MINYVAVCWTPSNICGLYLAISIGQSISVSGHSLTIIRGPSCSLSSVELESLSDLFLTLNLSSFRVISLNDLRFSKYFKISPWIVLVFNGHLIWSRPVRYLFPSPASPPIAVFPLFEVFYYGDGLVSLPRINYQWQVAGSSVQLKFRLRRVMMKFNLFLLSHFSRCIDISLSDQISNPVFGSKFYDFSFKVYRSSLECSLIPPHDKLDILILSVLSPARTTVSGEIDLYIEFIRSQIFAASTSGSSLYIKFHPHHADQFKFNLLARLRSYFDKADISEFVFSGPVESSVLVMHNLFPYTKLSVYVFQESVRVLSSVVAPLIPRQSLDINFGFPDRLIRKYFIASEVEKRLLYQKNILRDIPAP